ncbi:hypothetical protein [uncultured Roseobacter sp.]|uniref:hypothetical protein n=1 Tax=uncultured Roseobacter sp. TaxID=114847 RepID=UPI002627AEFC|nr:hypothetical protein [uncultured Roseobacter sp.]
MQTAPIGWTYTGGTDPLCGTGASPAERFLAYGMASLFTGFILLVDHSREVPVAEGWRIFLLAFFAFDIAGGAVANMLNSCKRFYHSDLQPGEGLSARLAKTPMLFTAIHVHPIIIAYFLGGSLLNAVVWYILLLASVALVLVLPLYLRRAAATGLTVLALFGNQYLLPLGAGLEWFIPCLFIKMVLGHAVQEEPYRAG